MDKLVFSCFLLGGLTPDPVPTDPCTVLNGYCAAGVTNVGCNPPALTGGPVCDDKSPQVVELVEAEKNAILSKINDGRNTIASGMHGNLPANRMFKLQWDADLATQAGHNARSCVVARDACRNTADYANVGQFILGAVEDSVNVAFFSTQDFTDFMLDYASHSAYLDDAASFDSYSSDTDTENEANLWNDRSTKVGCAVTKWTVSTTSTVYLVCNFSANVIEGEPIYTTAATPGAGCATTDPTYSSLCLT